MRRCLIIALSVLLLAGCSTFVPKRVEFFQDKVAQMPEPTAREREVQKQTAQRAYERAQQTYTAALTNHCVPAVTIPAEDTVILTRSVSTSLGPPVSPATEPSKELAARLDSVVAKLDRRLEDFREDNDKNTGKKIEGTGVFTVPYFVWVGGALALAFIGFQVLKLVLTVAAAANPGAGLALGGLTVAGNVAAKGIAQIVKGGQNFKDWVGKNVDDSKLKEQLIEAFRAAHQQAQDTDVQHLVQAIKK